MDTTLLSVAGFVIATLLGVFAPILTGFLSVVVVITLLAAPTAPTGFTLAWSWPHVVIVNGLLPNLIVWAMGLLLRPLEEMLEDERKRNIRVR
jgi:flagellar biosynthesis protein FliQ